MKNKERARKNILYGAPPIKKQKGLLVLLGHQNLPFAPQETLENEEQILLLGDTGQIFFLDPKKQAEVTYPLPPEYSVSPTLNAETVAAISQRDNFIALSHNNSYRLLETADKRLIFASGPGAQIQATAKGLLLFEPEAKKILFHKWGEASAASLFIEVIEGIRTFYPGQSGALYQTGDNALTYLDASLESHALGITTSDHLLFTEGKDGLLYIVHNNELISYHWQDKRWEASVHLERDPKLLKSWQDKALLLYPGGQLEVFSGKEKILSASLPPQTTSISPASGILTSLQGKRAFFWSFNV